MKHENPTSHFRSSTFAGHLSDYLKQRQDAFDVSDGRWRDRFRTKSRTHSDWCGGSTGGTTVNAQCLYGGSKQSVRIPI